MIGKLHPVVDAVLTAQRAEMKRLIPADMSLAEQQQISEQLYWHAMFSLAMLNPGVDMKRIANLGRDAIKAGMQEAMRR